LTERKRERDVGNSRRVDKRGEAGELRDNLFRRQGKKNVTSLERSQDSAALPSNGENTENKINVHVPVS